MVFRRGAKEEWLSANLSSLASFFFIYVAVGGRMGESCIHFGFGGSAPVA